MTLGWNVWYKLGDSCFLPGNEYFLRTRKYDRRIDHSDIYNDIFSFSFDM